MQSKPQTASLACLNLFEALSNQKLLASLPADDIVWPAGTIISVPTPENVLEAASTPAPTIASMRSMTVFEV